jgi:hemoglobin-like flavoprotein
MISDASRPYIDASVPVLRQHGLAITRLFYKNMFKAHPELTRLFNMGNQASGVQQQSLASAVFAYAANIGNPGALGPVVKRIVHKHVSVGIRAEHYPIVGHHLLGAISDTLGDAATQPLLDAWKEAYNSLAKLLIAAEAEMYSTAGIQPGETRPMRVTEVKRESDNVMSIRFVAATASRCRPSSRASTSASRSTCRTAATSCASTACPMRRAPTACASRSSAKMAPTRRPAKCRTGCTQNVQVGSVLQVSHPFGEFVPDTESTTDRAAVGRRRHHADGVRLKRIAAGESAAPRDLRPCGAQCGPPCAARGSRCAEGADAEPVGGEFLRRCAGCGGVMRAAWTWQAAGVAARGSVRLAVRPAQVHAGAVAGAAERGRAGRRACTARCSGRSCWTTCCNARLVGTGCPPYVRVTPASN